MQNVICAIRNCGYCSPNGFCLNRCVVINEQGVCKYITKPGWEQGIERQFKSSYNYWEGMEQEPVQEEEKRVTLSKLLETRPPVQNSDQTSQKKDQDQNKSGKDQPPHD